MASTASKRKPAPRKSASNAPKSPAKPAAAAARPAAADAKPAPATAAADRPAPATATAAADKPAPATATAAAAPQPAATPVPKVATVSDPVMARAGLRKRELIDRVVARSGCKKRDAKPVVEAMLAELGEALGEGRELNLQPLGKLRINRLEEKPNGRIIVCKLRQKLSRGGGTKDPLADVAE